MKKWSGGKGRKEEKKGLGDRKDPPSHLNHRCFDGVAGGDLGTMREWGISRISFMRSLLQMLFRRC